MGRESAIEWTDSTWSPLRVRVRNNAAEIASAKGYASLVKIAERMAGHVGQHCEHVSPGCEHCYAETFNHRCLPASGTGLPYERRSRDLVEAFVDEDILLQPLKWRPALAPVAQDRFRQRRRRIFVENQSDLFGEWYTDEMLDRVFAMMTLCPQHDFQVLTKRPERRREYLTGVHAAPNGDMTTARGECSLAFGRPARFFPRAFKSLPLNQNVTKLRWPLPNVWLGVSDEGDHHERLDVLRRTPAALRFISFEPLLCDPGTVDLSGIDWVIVGGESGPKARPMNPDWVRSLRDQCAAAGVPFFFKQWGEYLPAMCEGAIVDGRQVLNASDKPIRVGKEAAGAKLDGCHWRQYPERA